MYNFSDRGGAYIYVIHTLESAQSVRLSRVYFSMRIQRTWQVMLSTAVILAATRTTLAAGSGSGSGAGDTEGTEACIRPPGAPSLASQTKRIADAVLKARCLAICLEEKQQVGLEQLKFLYNKCLQM